ncbi:hypothetical protein BH160DRAFT_1912 [Burkholderia sp. H160]|nr:hypothetical protein BH160DRAFT_1912 [Burkholderia sp. H160]
MRYPLQSDERCNTAHQLLVQFIPKLRIRAEAAKPVQTLLLSLDQFDTPADQMLASLGCSDAFFVP